MKEILIEQGAQIVSTLVITLIGLLATWLTAKLNKHMQLKNLSDAIDECLKMTQITVGELQQKFVDGMKAANEDGKLTKEEVTQLNASLVAYTRNKLSPSIIDIITSAGVDINQFILDAGENYIQGLKK